MNKTSLLMLVVGTILGIVIGYVTFSEKPEYNIEAEGFRKVNYENEKFNIEIVKRVEGDLKVVKNIQLPSEGFLKGYQALADIVNNMVDNGRLPPAWRRSPPLQTDAAETPTQE